MSHNRRRIETFSVLETGGRVRWKNLLHRFYTLLVCTCSDCHYPFQTNGVHSLITVVNTWLPKAECSIHSAWNYARTLSLASATSFISVAVCCLLPTYRPPFVLTPSSKPRSSTDTRMVTSPRLCSSVWSKIFLWCPSSFRDNLP